MTRRATRWVAGVLAVSSLGAAGCAGENATPAENVFTIGVLLPLTGATAWGGQPARIAAEMAVGDINDGKLAGGYRVDLVVADGACEPRTAYAAAEKLVHQDHVQLLIGEWCSSATIAAAQVASESSVPMLVPISTADGIAADAGPSVFQSAMENVHIQEREATLLLEKFRFTSVAILVENNDFGLSFRKNMRAILKKAGVTIVLDVAQDRQDVNWYSVLTRIKDAAPDMVVLSVAAGQAANFVKQYAESQLTAPVFSDFPPPPYIFERQVGQQAGRIGLVRGAFFVASPRSTDRQKAFVSRFEPAVQAALGEARPALHWDLATYDAVMMAADAVARAGGTEADALVQALASTRHQGVLGLYQFNEQRTVDPAGFDFQFIRTTPEGGLELIE